MEASVAKKGRTEAGEGRRDAIEIAVQRSDDVKW